MKKSEIKCYCKISDQENRDNQVYLWIDRHKKVRKVKVFL